MGAGRCEATRNPKEKGTSKGKRSDPRPSLSVSADGKGVAAHAGTRLLAEMADFVGLTSALSDAPAPTVRRKRRHDPGRVLLDTALTLADGGDYPSDLAVLRDQPALFGAVASTPTAGRVVDSVDASGSEPYERQGPRLVSGPGRPGCSRCARPGRSSSIRCRLGRCLHREERRWTELQGRLWFSPADLFSRCHQ